MSTASAMRPTAADLRALIAPHEPPCISLYEPTHRSYPASSQEDPIRYRKLLQRAEESLRERYPARVVRPVVEKLEQFATDTDFWVGATGATRSSRSRSGTRSSTRALATRWIPREITERASKISRLPLMLAALPEHQTHFRTLSHNPFLATAGVELSPAALKPGELREAAWKAIEPYFEERLRALLDAYGQARGHGRGADRLEDIASALAQSRVATLLVEQDRRIPGSVDVIQGTIAVTPDAQADAADPGASDVLDDLAEAALRTGAEVIVLQADRMPSGTGAAAVFRY